MTADATSPLPAWFEVGSRVDYAAVVGEPPTRRGLLIRETWRLGDGTPVANLLDDARDVVVFGAALHALTPSHAPPPVAVRGARVTRRDGAGVQTVRAAFRNDRGSWFVDLVAANGDVAKGVPVAALTLALAPDAQSERDDAMQTVQGEMVPATPANGTTLATVTSVSERMLHLIKTGDIGRMSDEEQLIYYKHECDRMGLDPMARPFEFMSLNGKRVLYAKRIAGDMLAAKYRVTVQLMEGPEVRKFGTVEVLYVKARATMPDGRFVEDVGTKPLADVGVNVMKCVTVSIRRATLRLCGWGGLDESELEDMPPDVNPRGESEVLTADAARTLDILSNELKSADTLDLVVGAYNDNHDAIHAAGGNAALIRAADICKDWLEANVGKGLKTKFAKAINGAENERRTKIKPPVDPNADPLATTPVAPTAHASQSSDVVVTTLGASLDECPDFRTLCEVWNAVLEAHRAGKFGQPALDKLMDRFNAKAQAVQSPAERVGTLEADYGRAANAEDVERCDRAVKALKLDKASAERKQLAAANVAARTRLGLPVKAPRAPKAGEQPSLPGTAASAAPAATTPATTAPASGQVPGAPETTASAAEDDPERAAIESEPETTPAPVAASATADADPFADEAPAPTAAPEPVPDFPVGAKIRAQEWADKQKGRPMQWILNSFGYHCPDFVEAANTVKLGVELLLQFEGVKDGNAARDMLKAARDKKVAERALSAVAGRPAS